ncbi:hypothetical protein CI807_18465 [Pseudomonas sp. NS1(2017)]|uniref:hypothetical protein n=1 Tax=Pseudomonas sp. NS1(2017) TaxID=2025658 RepID=UPI000BA24A77|nr:hypothetical protein [Pseudomonas sp. NS1(2017)]ASV38080.1 hypothetical protein CI807_18465 [Pseudomonas sp. NS1(2017)]
MAGSREIALEQALIALIAAAEESDVDMHAWLGKATSYIMDSGGHFNLGSAYSVRACKEISDAHADVLTRIEAD